VNRSSLALEGDILNTDMDYGTPTICLLIMKLSFKSVVSTLEAKIMGLDLNNGYLKIPMERPECFRMKLSNFPNGDV
jgi:hypothetical protein